MTHFTYNIHPEKNIDDFTILDGTVKFYTFVNAILLRTKATEVLDFGAGRGAAFVDDTSIYRRKLRDLRAFGAKVTACDVDNAVLSHPRSDRQVVIKAGAPLPFEDESFDVIVSDMTFEHILEPQFAAKELLRILRPGGFICARTPNQFSYVRIASGLVPNSVHAAVLRFIQPNRQPSDVFPTVYRMNSLRRIRRLFSNCRVFHYYDNAEPSYYFGNPILYKLFLIAHRLLPKPMSTSLVVFIEKSLD